MKIGIVHIILLLVLSVQVQAQQTDSTAVPSKSQKARKSIPKHEVSIMCGESTTVTFYMTDITEYEHSMGAFSTSYFYRLKKWFSIGATSTYIPYNTDRTKHIYNVTETNVQSEKKTTILRGSVLSIAAEVRFYVYTNSWVNLYGGFSFGYTADFSINNIANNIPVYYEGSCYIQPTLFGFSFGKNIIFGGELGLGSRGIISAYMGYKF